MMRRRGGRACLLGLLPCIGLAAMFGVSGTAWGAFGNQGKVVTPIGSVSSGQAVAIARDQKVVVAGTSNLSATFDFAALRYRRNGSADNSFAGDGSRVDDLGGFEVARSILALPSGKVVVAGGDSTLDRGVLLRYRKNGSPDSSFSGDGRAFMQLADPTDFRAIARQRDGKIVLAGTIAGDMLITRYRANGQLDPTFADNGIRRISVEDATRATGVTMQGRKIVVVGSTSGGLMGDPDRPLIVRLRPNGKFDKTFSGDGRKRVVMPDSASLNDVVARGKRIIAVGDIAVGLSRRPLLIALNNRGGFNRKFAGKGKRVYAYGANTQAEAIAFQGRKLVIAGERRAPIANFFLARFTARGKIDKSFSGNGFRTTDFGQASAALDLAVQRNKRIVAVGTTDDAIALARYRPNGALDK